MVATALVGAVAAQRANHPGQPGKQLLLACVCARVCVHPRTAGY